MGIESALAAAVSFTVRLRSTPRERARPPGPTRALVRNPARASTMTARDTVPEGSKVVAVVPAMTPSSAIWLMAPWNESLISEMSVKPMSLASGRVTPAGPAARCSITANCQREMDWLGAKVVAVVPLVMP